jgi:hypothetical protein
MMRFVQSYACTHAHAYPHTPMCIFDVRMRSVRGEDDKLWLAAGMFRLDDPRTGCYSLDAAFSVNALAVAHGAPPAHAGSRGNTL